MNAGHGVAVALVAVDLSRTFEARSCIAVLPATDVLQCAHGRGACDQTGGPEPTCGGLGLRGELVDELANLRGELDPGSGSRSLALPSRPFSANAIRRAASAPR